MKLTDLFVEQLQAEANRTRRVLEQMPEGRDDWKPHDKSMPFGRLAMLVARMPSWVSLIIEQDSLNLGGSNVDQRPLRTSAALVQAHDEAVAGGLRALAATTDETLTTTKWQLVAGGQAVLHELRYIVLRDTLMHWSHHRGQLTVYLRLNNLMVPAIYGPSADDQRFA
jgi:uncharacterized damage-inducible protein DinB